MCADIYHLVTIRRPNNTERIKKVIDPNTVKLRKGEVVIDVCRAKWAHYWRGFCRRPGCAVRAQRPLPVETQPTVRAQRPGL